MWDDWRQFWRHGWKRDAFSRGLRSLVALASLTLLGALGERYRAMAFATLILAIYTALAAQPQPGHASAPWSVSLLLAGAAWYGLIAVLWAAPLPMLTVRQKMAALYEVLGVYLQLKSRLLEPVRGIDLERRRLSLALQIYFVTQDVHERVTSSHDQYDVLANAFFHSDLLYRCQRVLDLLPGAGTRHRAARRHHAQALGAAHQRHGAGPGGGLGVAALIP